MKKEDIEKAATQYAQTFIEGSITAYNSFKVGADWRINSVWHEVEEEPKESAWFIAQIGDCSFDTFVMAVERNRWKRWCKGMNINVGHTLMTCCKRKENEKVTGYMANTLCRQMGSIHV